MKTKEFENAKQKDLQRKANECFEKLDDVGSHEKPAILIEAQFYMGEIERRRQHKIAILDLILGMVSIVLIALSLYFEIAGGNKAQNQPKPPSVTQKHPPAKVAKHP